MQEKRLEAARKGEKFYADTCSRCTGLFKYVSTGKCVQCTKLAAQSSYAKNKAILEGLRK